MIAVSDYGCELLAGVITRQSTMPSTLYVALCTTVPDGTMSGSDIDEPSGGGYGRVSVANSSSGWSAPDGDHVVNDADWDFGTAGAAWGRVAWFALCDDDTGGNVIFLGRLSEAIVVNNGGAVKILAGTVSLSVGSLQDLGTDA